jgi:heme/copper-type cytochrome/quinol oxidase subunit 2
MFRKVRTLNSDAGESPKRNNITYGQCSEVCGANHRFIPIAVEKASTNQFINLVSKIRESSDD